jgi:hypothetical protein
MMTEGRFGEIVAPMRRALVQRNTAYKHLSPSLGQ